MCARATVPLTRCWRSAAPHGYPQTRHSGRASAQRAVPHCSLTCAAGDSVSREAPWPGHCRAAAGERCHVRDHDGGTGRSVTARRSETERCGTHRDRTAAGCADLPHIVSVAGRVPRGVDPRDGARRERAGRRAPAFGEERLAIACVTQAQRGDRIASGAQPPQSGADRVRAGEDSHGAFFWHCRAGRRRRAAEHCLRELHLHQQRAKPRMCTQRRE